MTIKRPINAYFAHAIHGTSPQFLDTMNEVKDSLVAIGFNILAYADGKVTDAEDIFEHDMKMIADCEVMIVIVDKASTGIGMEIMEALHSEKTVIAFKLNTSHISPMVTGCNRDKYDIINLVDYHQIPAILSSILH
jgi:nucleoside 2-deoxyribosyltransferase